MARGDDAGAGWFSPPAEAPQCGVLGPTGEIGLVIELRDCAAKKQCGRLIPIHPSLRTALAAWRKMTTGTGPVIRSERGGPMTPFSIVNCKPTDSNKEHGGNSVLPGKQEGKPIGVGLQPQQARENALPPAYKDPSKRGKGRPPGSVNRYTRQDAH
jgi:hypothetical protein